MNKYIFIFNALSNKNVYCLELYFALRFAKPNNDQNWDTML